MRTLCIDYGTRRVGLALSDEGGTFSTPLDVLFINSPDEGTSRVLDLVRKEQVKRLLVGIPLNMDGTIGPAARQTADWARRVAERAGVSLALVDERLSSFEAEQRLADRKRGGEKMTRRQKKQRLDALVAQQLLQEFLDGRLPAIEISE